jgi:hypothetical protein
VLKSAQREVPAELYFSDTEDPLTRDNREESGYGHLKWWFSAAPVRARSMTKRAARWNEVVLTTRWIIFV